MGGRGSGGAGGSRGGGSNNIKNSSGASEEAVGFIQEAKEQIKKYGNAQVVINENKAIDYDRTPKATNPKDTQMEQQLKNLASENGLSINFKTKTENSTGVRRQLVYGSSQKKTQTKQRIMYAYRT